MKKKLVAGLLAISMVLGNVMPVVASEVEETKIEETEIVQEEVKTEEQTKVLVEEKVASDIVEIRDENLKRVICDKVDGNGDRQISKTEMESLTELYLSNYGFENGIIDLSGIEWAVNLEELYIDSFYGGIKAISAIGSLVNLKKLTIGDSNIVDISVLSNLQNLETLSLYRNNISDISELSNLKKLTYLDLSSNKIKDISGVAGLTSLELLDLSENEIEDVRAISGLTNLTHLELNQNVIKDVSAIYGLSKLELLFLEENKITDISLLNQLQKIMYVELKGNPITDISILKNLKGRMPSISLSGVPEFKKQVFEMFSEDMGMSLLVGNAMAFKIPDEAGFIRCDDMKLSIEDIEWKIENESIAKKSSEGYVVGMSEGNTIINATVEGLTKTLKVQVVAPMPPVKYVAENTPGIQAVRGGDVCAVYDEDKTLWSLNGNKKEKVASNVGEYISAIVYGKNKEENWGRYLIRDTQNSVWSYNKNSYGETYESKKLAENVEKYFVKHEGYTPQEWAYYNRNKWIMIDPYVLTTNHEFKNIDTNKVYETGVEKIEKEEYGSRESYALLKQGQMKVYAFDNGQIVAEKSVADVKDILSNGLYVMNDGSTWRWTYWEDDWSNTYSIEVEKIHEKELVDKVGSYILDKENILWKWNGSTQSYSEKILTNIKEIHLDDMGGLVSVVNIDDRILL